MLKLKQSFSRISEVLSLKIFLNKKFAAMSYISYIPSQFVDFIYLIALVRQFIII